MAPHPVPSEPPLCAVACAAALLGLAAPAAAGAPPVEPVEIGIATTALTPTSWLLETTPSDRYLLPTSSELGLLEPYRRPGVERPFPLHTFRDGAFGVSRWRLAPALAWSPTGCGTDDAPAAARTGASLRLAPSARVLPARLSGVSLLPTWALAEAPRPLEDVLDARRAKPCKPWTVRRPVTLARYGAEVDSPRLLECDGSVAPDAIDRLSVMARPPGVPRPSLPLPLEPSPGSLADGEWVPGVKILHPRLIWALQRIADAFPRRPLYLISGYRRESPSSFHYKGRALDLFVMGVSNEDLFRFCRKLRDVACGYYPNNSFVHVDIRPPGSGHAIWVDVSRPGEPSEYVDAWPGVVDGGALRWAGQH